MARPKSETEFLFKTIGDDAPITLTMRELSQLLTQADRSTARLSKTDVSDIEPWRDWEAFVRRLIHERNLAHAAA